MDTGVRRARIRKKISQQRSGKGSDLERLSDFLNRNKHNVSIYCLDIVHKLSIYICERYILRGLEKFRLCIFTGCDTYIYLLLHVHNFKKSAVGNNFTSSARDLVSDIP